MLDVGGGGGVHAAWLAADGYDVHLVDPVPKHIEAARHLSDSLERGFTADEGDARDIDQADGTADVTLLFGPLYHLPDRADRERVWAEARRVTKPGGLILAKVISRWAATLDLFIRPPMEPAPGFVAIAYFHAADEAAAEAGAAGLHVRASLGVQGAGWLVSDFDARWDDVDLRQELIDRARQLEAAPELMGIHAHLIVVADVPA